MNDYADVEAIVTVSTAAESRHTSGHVSVDDLSDSCQLSITTIDGTRLGATLDPSQAIEVILGLCGFVGKSARGE